VAILAIAVLAVLVPTLKRDGPAALDAWRAAHVQWPLVALAVALGFCGHAVYVFGWQRLLADSEIPARFWSLAQMFLVSNLGRYLSGAKAWQMGIVLVMSAEEDLPAAVVAGSSLLQGMVGVGVGVFVLLATGGAALKAPPALMTLPVAGMIALLLTPWTIRSIPRLHAMIAHRIKGIDTITTATMWTLIWTSAASWVLWGFALYTLASALLPSPGASIISYVATWAAAFLAGIIAFFSPAGLGASEGAMHEVLSRAGMRTADILVIIVVTRMWRTVLDVAPAAIVLAYRWITRRDARASAA
jgi:hypothetical protein